jgi:NAD(P) transhydrogenase subunit alpha
MRIAIPRETEANEPRVGGTPDTVKRLKALGADLVVETGAGIGSGILDSDFEAAGATVAANAVKDADLVLKVQPPDRRRDSRATSPARW